jgi:hypothetical protein
MWVISVFTILEIKAEKFLTRYIAGGGGAFL